MAKKHSEERHMQKMIELGKQNAELLPKVKGWCKHIQVRMTSRGMLAEISNLPIGSIAISCEHASNGGIESMHLQEVAASFILKNCRGCPFHQTADIDNIGHVILRECEALQVEAATRKESAVAGRQRLKEMVSGELLTALREENVTTQSVLELVNGLDDGQHHIESAKKLIRASDIAPEFFSELAIEVVCSHFPER